jgi:hypothetical protein
MDHRNRDRDAPRIALAAAVGVLSVLAALGVAIALSGGSAASGAIAKVPPNVPGATALNPERVGHGQSVPGMTEHQLREFEIATLGPGHAREHALMRRAMREGERVREELGPSKPLARIAAAGPASEVGEWDPSATVTFGVVAIHAAMLPTGKVLIFSYPKDPLENSTRVYLWDPENDPEGTNMERKDPPLWLDPKDGQMKAANIWCAGQTFTADGELVVFGGNLEFPDPNATPATDYKGLNKVYTFNPFDETWTEQPDMQHGRWYPTGVRIPDGRIPILSGWDESGLDVMNEDVEIFNPSSTIGGVGSVGLIGHTGDTGEPPTGEYYPHMFSMPSGKTLVVGPDQFNTWFMNTPTSNSFTWAAVQPLDQRRLWGTAVLMPTETPGVSSKVMVLGGTNESTIHSTNTTAVFDENSAGAGWQSAPSNVIGRGHANTVLLPDGSMVEVGGGVGSDATLAGYNEASKQFAANPDQRQIELWDPTTKQWRLGPAQAEARAYHSTALLLPDGRVMSAGDDYNGAGGPNTGIQSDTAEIYEPPYLHKGPRPSITSVQQTIGFGNDFAVQTPDNNVTKATLMAPSAVTHAVDMNQRFVALQVSRHDHCVQLKAPANGRVAPPGWYMLFLLNDQGVPSKAKWVKLQSGGGATSCSSGTLDTTPPANVSVSAPGGSLSGDVTLTAGATDNVGVTRIEFKVDGNLIGTDTSAPFSIPWDTRTVGSTSHTLTAVAYDAAGNFTSSPPVSVTVANAAAPDTADPSVWLTFPGAGATLGGSVTLTAGATDNVGVAGVRFTLDGQTLGAEDTTAPYSLAWNTSSVGNGSHTLSAVARDAAGNTRTAATVGVTVANATKGPPPPPDLAPAISRLKLSASSFRKSATIGFKLSEAAKVTLSFERRLSGRKRHGKCMTSAKKGARCTLYRKLSSKTTVDGSAGMNSLRLGRRGMSAGSYRLTLVATDAGGKRSAAARTAFRLLAPAAHRSSRAVETAIRSVQLAF